LFKENTYTLKNFYFHLCASAKFVKLLLNVFILHLATTSYSFAISYRFQYFLETLRIFAARQLRNLAISEFTLVPLVEFQLHLILCTMDQRTKCI